MVKNEGEDRIIYHAFGAWDSLGHSKRVGSYLAE